MTLVDLYDNINNQTITVTGWFRGFKSLQSTIKHLKDQIVIAFNNDDKITITQQDDIFSVFLNKKLIYKSKEVDIDWIVELYKEYLKKKGWKQIQ